MIPHLTQSRPFLFAGVDEYGVNMNYIVDCHGLALGSRWPKQHSQAHLHIPFDLIRSPNLLGPAERLPRQGNLVEVHARQIHRSAGLCAH